jgi:hypothetical protein
MQPHEYGQEMVSVLVRRSPLSKQATLVELALPLRPFTLSLAAAVSPASYPR